MGLYLSPLISKNIDTLVLGCTHYPLLKELITNITLDTLIILDRKERNKIFVLENIYFGYDSADIRKDAARELDARPCDCPYHALVEHDPSG